MVVGVGSQSWASFHSCRGRPRIWWGSRGRRPRWGPPSCWRCRGWPEGDGDKWFINTTLPNSARNELSQSFHNLVHWLKTSAFTFKTLLRHYAKEAYTTYPYLGIFSVIVKSSRTSVSSSTPHSRLKCFYLEQEQKHIINNFPTMLNVQPKL